jgi:hypothetical protein
VAKNIDSVQERVDFLVNKVQALVAEQEQGRRFGVARSLSVSIVHAGRGIATTEDDEVPFHASETFREFFPQLNDRLVSYFQGTIQKTVPIQCTVYLTVTSMALYHPLVRPTTEVVKWTDVTSITKAKCVWRRVRSL